MTSTSARTLPGGADQTTLPSVDHDLFRALMGSLVSGVTILTSRRPDDSPVGMTCSAVCSVSADPPLLLACVRRPSATLDAIAARGRFAVNVLDAEGGSASATFAGRVQDKFALVDWFAGTTTGMPVLAGGVAHTECAVHELVQAGDHVLVLGRIVGGEAHSDRFPLGYWRGSYTRVLRIPQQ